MWRETISLFSNPKITKKVQNLSLLFFQFCRAQSERISQRIAQITVRLNLINVKHRYVLRDDVKEIDKHAFLEECLNFLVDKQNISSLTIKIQSLFHGRYLSREAFKDHQKQAVMKNCCPLVQKLRKSWHNPSEDHREMHNDLVRLILIKEGMEDEDDPSAIDEMRTAVNSIFPASALSTFVVSNQKTKMAFINEISSIAAGIRLHAWYSRKAGKFMFDVGKIMKETLPKINEDLHEELANVKEKVKSLQEELTENIDKGTEKIYSGKDFEKLLLIYLTNYCKFLVMIKESIQEVTEHTYRLDYTFTMQMKELDSSLKTGPFTKVNRVYPSYKDVARTWKGIQLEGHLLNFYSNLYQELKALSTGLHLIHPGTEVEASPIQLETTGEVDSATEISPGEVKNLEESTLENQDVHLVYPREDSIKEIDLATKLSCGDVKNFRDITLEYQEFCAFYCSRGILVPCNRNLGVVMYKNLCYGFSSIEALDYFMIQPNKCVTAVKEHILKTPELIMTLQMEIYFNFPVTNVFKSKRVLPIFITNSSAQTVLHPTERKLDQSYEWNQWSMRKKALKYADLLGKKTHSTQTDLSHFRRENCSQVYLPKDSSTQTPRDASTNITRADLAELLVKTKKTFQ